MANSNFLGGLDKIITMFLISFLIMGIRDAMTLTENTINVPLNTWDALWSGDFKYIGSAVMMSWGWLQATPTFPIDMMPTWTRPYQWYCELFFPEGYMPTPGWEDCILLILLSLILVGISLLVKALSRGRRTGLPIWIWLLIPIIVLLLYPIWKWFNLVYCFGVGAEVIMGITKEEARLVWASFSEQVSGWSWFFLGLSAFGIYKGIKMGWKYPLKSS